VTVGADRVGADVGGTFTDVILDDGAGGVLYEKILSTPPSYDRAVVDATRRLLARAADGRARRVLAEVVHGTTVATNAVLERRGARTAIVTTEGFRDVLELRRMRMPHLYDYFWNKPPPLVPRHLRFEVSERMGADGQVIIALDEDNAMAVAARLREGDAEAVAICLLHSHRYPEHERRLGEILRRELPEIPISLSSEILREEQEYERTATTAVNAYVTPLMSGYLRDILRGIETIGSDAPLMIMQSSGGVMTADDAAQRPVYALESGPAAGVVAALGLA
jgi:N-methylhydantoinase A